MDKRQAIKESAALLFRKRGFRDVSVAEIMRIAGFATGTFYLYFTSKEVLFLEIYRDENERILGEVTSTLGVDLSRHEVIAIFLHHSQKVIKRNQILNVWQDEGLSDEIRKAYRDGSIDSLSFVGKFLDSLFSRWRAEGRLKRPVSRQQIDKLSDALISLSDFRQDGYEETVDIIGNALGEYFISSSR